MLLHLLADQVALGDFNLLILSISLQPDDFHPIKQRLRQIKAVRCRHKHDVRQV